MTDYFAGTRLIWVEWYEGLWRNRRLDQLVRIDRLFRRRGLPRESLIKTEQFKGFLEHNSEISYN